MASIVERGARMEGFRDCLKSERLRLLYDYWLRIRPAPDRLPGRAHLDPLDIPAILPWIILFDMGQGPADTRYRLVGTQIVERVGRDFTGRLLSEGYWGHDTDKVLEDYWAVAQAGRPELWQRRMVDREGIPHAYDYLLLPLASDGKRVDILLAGVAFDVWIEENIL